MFLHSVITHFWTNIIYNRCQCFLIFYSFIFCLKGNCFVASLWPSYCALNLTEHSSFLSVPVTCSLSFPLPPFISPLTTHLPVFLLSIWQLKSRGRLMGLLRGELWKGRWRIYIWCSDSSHLNVYRLFFFWLT